MGQSRLRPKTRPQSRHQLRPQSCHQSCHQSASFLLHVLVLKFLETEANVSTLLSKLGSSNRIDLVRRYLRPLLSVGLIERTIPDKPTSRFQKYRLTAKGRAALASLIKSFCFFGSFIYHYHARGRWTDTMCVCIKTDVRWPNLLEIGNLSNYEEVCKSSYKT